MTSKTKSTGELKTVPDQSTQLTTLDSLGQALSFIENANEVQLKEIIDGAEALRVYAQQAKSGLEIQNRCAEVKLRAEKKLGELLKDMPKDNKGGDRKSQSHGATVIRTLKSLGLDKHQSSRYQTIASLSDKEFEEHVAKVKASNDELTTVGVIRLARGLNTHVSHNTGDNEWYTPKEYIAAANEVMGSIDTDPASSEEANKTVGAEAFFTKEEDGLKEKWSGNVWMNPPYAKQLIPEFIDAAVSKYKSKEIKQVLILVNNATETGWFQDLLSACSVICFIKGRVKFLDPNGNQGAPLQGQAVIYLGDNIEGFKKSFCSFGKILLTDMKSVKHGEIKLIKN